MKRGASLLSIGFLLALAAETRAQSAPVGNGLTAGGLAPPGAGQNTPSTAAPATEQELQRAEREDVGRGLEWFWINGEIGFEHLGLQTFRGRQLVDTTAVHTTQSGLVVGGGLGARLVYVTLGPRFRFAKFSDFSLWNLNAEVAFRIPIGRYEPYAGVSGGYVSVGSVHHHSGPLGSQDLGIRGWDLRAGGGLDVFLTPRFSVGGMVTAECLFLARGAVSGGAGVYVGDGSSIGAALAVTASAGLHF